MPLGLWTRRGVRQSQNLDKTMRNLLAFSLVLLLSLGVFSCRNKKKDDTPTDTLKSGIIQIYADENLRNIVNAEIDAFCHRYPEAFVFVEYTNEAEAIKMLIDDSTKLVITARDLDSREKGLVRPTQVIRKYPFGYEGVAFVINRQNPDSILTRKHIEQILLGDIQSWKDINSGTSLDSIRIFFSDDKNGVMRYVSDSITKGEPTKSHNFYKLEDGEDMFAKVASNPNNIGIIGFNQIGNYATKKYNANMEKARLLRVAKADKRTPKESALPYAGDVLYGNYPYWRPLYVQLGESREGLAKGFCFFLTQQVGQKVVQKAGLMPVTDANKVMTRWVEE